MLRLHQYLVFSKQLAIFKCSSELFQLFRQNYMRTGKYVFNSDGVHLYTLRDKFSCNAVNVVYQITCAGYKQPYIGETQDFHQRMNLHKSDVRTLNTHCLADLHINWCLNIKYEHLNPIQYGLFLKHYGMGTGTLWLPL